MILTKSKRLLIASVEKALALQELLSAGNEAKGEDKRKGKGPQKI